VGKKEKNKCWAFQKYGRIALVGNVVNFIFLKGPANKKQQQRKKYAR
jgi:hypothetical protein